MKRIIIGMNFDWYFSQDFKKEYLKKGFNFQNNEHINIPHTMKELPFSYFNELESQFTGTYFKELSIEEESLDNQLFLKFYGVMNSCDIYLNSKKVKSHEGGYVPFEFSINEYITPGKNLLMVIVNGKETKDIPPFGGLVDYLPFSGIYREVYLIEKAKIHIENAYFFSDDINILEKDKMLLNFKVILNQEANDLKLKLKVLDDDNIIYENIFSEEITNENVLQAEIDGIIRWEIDNPKLYNLELTLLNGEEEIDSLNTKFGFRTLLFTDNGFYLNNQKIKLMGLNRHQSYPYIGYAAPKSLQEMDADILKSLGVNIVRTSHYMQSDHFINRCDEIGLLVFEEIPGWNYIGNEMFKELSLYNLKTMISHHFNHPSICLWGVRINESRDDDEFYILTNDLAHDLDPSRQTGGVRNIKKSHLLEDVYTYNDFSHTGSNDGLEARKMVTKEKCPYLVTEYNGHVFPTKKTDSEERRIEHSLRHLNVIEYNHYYDNISGAIGWCMTDYNTHFQFGSNDHICHHGVLDMHRLEKYAAYPYKSQINPNKEKVLFIASNMIAGDYNLLKLPEIIVYTNLDYIKVYKNGIFLDTYYPDKENYEYMPHPPIIINDLIGKSLENNENYSTKDTKRIKRILLSYNKNNFDMPLKDKITVLYLYLRKIIDFNDAIYLFGKYLANQEESPTVFTFEGYLDDKLVKTVYKGHMQESSIIIEPDRTVLYHGDTYDMVRVVVKMVDQFSNILDYGNEVFSVKTDDSLKVVGPKNLALNGGSTAFYLKTCKGTTNSKVELAFNNYPNQEINFIIKNGILEN
jgi:beta-galactosidase